MQKPPFSAKMVNFEQFWTKMAKREFFKKALGTFFSRLQALTNCKVSEKSNERFSSNRVTHGRVTNDFVERPKIDNYIYVH